MVLGLSEPMEKTRELIQLNKLKCKPSPCVILHMTYNVYGPRVSFVQPALHLEML